MRENGADLLRKMRKEDILMGISPHFLLENLDILPHNISFDKIPPLEGGEYSRIYAPAWKTNKQAELSQTQFSKSLTKLELSLAKNRVI